MRVKTKFLLSALALFSMVFGWTLGGQAFRATGIGRIADCPSSPNCLSSLSTGGRHWIAPLALDVSNDKAFQCLKEIIRQTQRATIVADEEMYIRAEFKTALGFVDDVEFELDTGNRSILMRSASRVGYWDLGVNRRRLEAVRAAFNSQCGTSHGSKQGGGNVSSLQPFE